MNIKKRQVIAEKVSSTVAFWSYCRSNTRLDLRETGGKKGINRPGWSASISTNRNTSQSTTSLAELRLAWARPQAHSGNQEQRGFVRVPSRVAQKSS
jgi:hypothetical protein